MKLFETVALRSYVQMAKQAAAEAWREKARQHGEPEEGLDDEFDEWWEKEFGEGVKT